MGKYHLEATNTALILIEYQNEWVSDQGSLRNKLIKDHQQFTDAIVYSKDILAMSRQRGLYVIHVTLKPDNNYNVFGKAPFGMRHVIPQRQTWLGFQGEIHPDFAPCEGEHVITERIGASAFSGSNLDQYLRNNHINNLLLIGFATHVCVESTLRAAHDLGYNTFVITQATGSFTEEQKQFFSQHIVQHFGQELSVPDFYDEINER